MGVAKALGKVFPLPVSFDDLRKQVEDRDELRRILFTLISSGFALFHIHPFTPPGKLAPRPRANRLARWESAHTGVVTYSTHTANKLDGLVRALIELLDGTRGFEEVASALSKVEGAPALQDIRVRLSEVVEHMWHSGLLEG
jgi:hypothetical protein